MMPNSKTLPDVIRRAIEKDGRSLYRLSKDSGVAEAVLSRFTRGERDLNLRTADRLCRVLRLELRALRKAGA